MKILITKTEALELCQDMWKWLAKNPEQPKHNWPGWKRKGGYVPSFVFDCPCCQFVSNGTRKLVGCSTLETAANRKQISRCPLKALWPKGCCHEDSPFHKWFHEIGDRTEHATKIAEACERELKKLWKGK